MRMKIDGRAVISALAFLVLCLGVATSGSAQQGLASAPDANAVQEIVTGVDAQAGTVVLGGETFTVSDRSVLLDAGGRPIKLGELRSEATGGEGDRVEFVATRSGSYGPHTIQRLQVMEGDFE